MDDNEIISNCSAFLKKSNERYRTSIVRAMTDLQYFSGNFWTDDLRKTYRKGKTRVNLALNNWNVLANAIASPFSASPWHTELVDKSSDSADDIQKSIDLVEQENDTKSSLIDAFRKMVLTGYGYLIVSTDTDDITGEPKIIVESARNINAVAIDANVNTVDGNDAEEGAIVNYMSVKKAKRLWGDDVVPMDYPNTQPSLSLSTFEQWNVPSNSVAVISYYVKNDKGLVDFYKICGNKVVQNVELPCTIIPIIRLAGNEIYESDEINYNGIIQQTFPLELGANIAYSTLIERCGRSTKANFMANIDAIDGLEKYYAKADQDESCLVLWKGDKQPVPLTESFQTGDLQATIQSCRTLMEDTVGVPLTGISQNQPEKTATEILRQQISKESNTANYYNNAYSACRTLARIIIQLLNEGIDLKFTLENGPSVITRQMKSRQEIQALSSIVPENMKPLMAKYFADTLENDIGKDLSRNIIANLPPEVKLISDETDPNAIHIMNQMKQQLDQMAQDLDAERQKNQELQKELNTAQLSLLENREARQLEWNKFQITETNKMNLETAKLQAEGIKDAGELDIKNKKLALEADKAMADVIQANNAEIADMRK